MAQKVLMRFSLSGNINRLYDEDNSKILKRIKIIVGEYFGERALKVIDEENVLIGEYPLYYCAGWFISEDSVDTSGGTELVLIAHGKSMEAARNNMMAQAKYADWNNWAAKI